MGKRLFDIVSSGIGLMLLSPLFLVIAVWIKLDSKGSVFYLQERIGKGGIPFRIYKFRTMVTGADKKGLLTVGNRDPRVTSIGYYLRRYKLDELPQLINVFKGDMSIVGPRPEVPKYVRLYSASQREVLSVKPGITDLASIKFRNENEILSAQEDSESYYIEHVMPEKLNYNMEYIQHQNFLYDLKVILMTFKAILMG